MSSFLLSGVGSANKVSHGTCNTVRCIASPHPCFGPRIRPEQKPKILEFSAYPELLKNEFLVGHLSELFGEGQDVGVPERLNCSRILKDRQRDAKAQDVKTPI